MISAADKRQCADLYGVLVAAVRACDPAVIRLNARSVKFRQSGNDVTVTPTNEDQLTGVALIGADGVHSSIRGALFGEDRPSFSGCVAWRGVVADLASAAAVRSQRRHELGGAGRGT